MYTWIVHCRFDFFFLFVHFDGVFGFFLFFLDIIFFHNLLDGICLIYGIFFSFPCFLIAISSQFLNETNLSHWHSLCLCVCLYVFLVVYQWWLWIGWLDFFWLAVNNNGTHIYIVIEIEIESKSKRPDHWNSFIPIRWSWSRMKSIANKKKREKKMFCLLLLLRLRWWKPIYRFEVVDNVHMLLS